jgi:mycothiol synthase
VNAPRHSPEVDPGDDLEVVLLHDDDHLREVIDLLDDAERAAGLPLIDESEQERLDALAAGGTRPASWRSALLRRGGAAVAYAAVVAPDTRDTPDAPDTPGAPAGTRRGSGDVAVRRPIRGAERVTARALEAARDLAAGLDLRHVQVWLRAVGPAEHDAAAAAGFDVERRLAVLGRALPTDDAVGAAALAALEASGTTIRSFIPDRDDDGVVAVLAAAYDGTEDGGWDLARFRERRGWSWFRAEDLLVAADPDGTLAGLHWLKRRGGGAGEVYNLAVHPDAQGRGVGPALLHAGLRHLVDIGCGEVVLWVDAANERAVRLYRRQGFTTRWEDIAVGSDTEVAGS